MDQAVNSGRMTPRYLKKREAILDAAAQLFNQRGLKGATLADVAARVDLSTNSITYYYKKKEDLVVACLLRSIEIINDILALAVEAPSAEERVRQFIKLFFLRLAKTDSRQATEMMTFRDVDALGSPHSDIVFAAYIDMFRRCRRLLIVDTLRLDNRLSLNARTHLLLTLTVNAMGWIGYYAPEDFELVAARTSDILIGGFATPDSRWRACGLDARLTLMSGQEASPQDDFLRAATALINEQGYRGASVDRISARLNVTKGSFYHHNPNKEDLVSACFERNFSVIRQMQEIALGSSELGWDKLRAVLVGLVRYQFSAQGPLLRMSAWSELPDDIREAKAQTIKQINQRFVSFLIDGMQDGSIRPLAQSIAGSLMIGMINAVVTLERWLPDVDTESAIDLFVRPLFAGILAKPA